MFFRWSIDKISHKTVEKIFVINLLTSVIFTIMYDIIQYKHFLRFGYNNPLWLYILGIVIVILLAYNKSLKTIFMICGAYSILHFAISMYYFPLAVERSDMLAAIALSIKQYINNFSPYYQSSTTVGIPPYLPITMLSFIPAYLLNFDFRVVGLVYWVITLCLIAYKYHTLEVIQKMAACLLIINPYFLMRHDLYFQFFLLEIIILCLYLNSFGFIAKGVFLAVFISTLQFAWILFPFALMAENKSIKSLILMALLSLTVGVIISFTYVHNGISDFIHAMFLHKEYSAAYSSDITFGLSTIFYFAKSQILLYVFQVVTCVVIVLFSTYSYVIKQIRNRGYYLSLAAVCYLLFMSTNYFIETYLLVPMLLFIILSFKSDKMFDWKY